MNALIVDFHGPIAFRFTDKEGCWAWAYIPICDYHTCNVLTDTDDISPEEHRIFEVQGPISFGKTKIPSVGAELIQEHWKVVKRKKPPTRHECYCIFKLPLPDYIVGLRKESVTIKRIKGHAVEREYARGHRFCYSKCGEPKIVPVEPAKATRLGRLDATYFQPVSGSDVKYRIEIRYHDINPLEPRPHRDAELCSLSMRKLFPPLHRWTVTFKDPEEAASFAGPHGTDCLAHGLVLNDGGIN